MRIVYLLIILLAVSTLAHAATLKVPTQFTTIQGAISAAVNGDTVLVDDGTYVENIDFLGKAITVTSVNGAGVTVIDGGNPVNPDFGSVVIFQTAEGPNSVLEGFTLTNGKGTLHVGPGHYDGGGISCWTRCSPTLVRNRIVNNSANGNGGGILLLDRCSPDIIECTVSSNSAPFGGGIGFWNQSSPTIKDCMVEGNTASQEGAGIMGSNNCSPLIEGCTIMGNSASVFSGGLEFYDNCSPTIMNNLILGNEAVNNGGGGLIISFYCSGIVANNIIANNTSKGITFGGGGISIDRYSDTMIKNNLIYGNSSSKGGGIDVLTNSTPSIINNTIYGNTAQYNGGGMRVNTDSKPVVTNSIFWNNTITLGSIGPEIWIGGMSELDISYSDVDGGKSSCWVSSNSTLIWGAGMIDADPLFVNRVIGDLHIPHHSPCCDTGDNTCSGLPVEDFEGDPRICYGTADMGADEHFRHLYYTGNATPGGSVDVIFTGLPGTNPVGLIAGSDVYDPPLPSMWGDWYVKFPWIGPINLGTMPTPDGVLIINGLIPGTPPGPYTIYMQAIIGDKLTNLCTMNVK